MWLKFLLFCVFGATYSLTASPDLGGVLSGNRMAGVPLGRSLGNGELDVEGICAEPGHACVNCTLAVTCIPLPIGYLMVPLQECTGSQTCNAHLGQCTDVAVPECEDMSQKYQHTCEQVGIFPDAHDCRKFHLCSPPEGTPFGRPADHRTALCPRHYGYNPQTAQCSVRLHKGQCLDKHVPTCTTIGQSGPLLTSANHYYVCLRRKQDLYPQIFLCPHGWFFWDGFCHPDQNPEATTKVVIAEVTTPVISDVISTDAATGATEENETETLQAHNGRKKDRTREAKKVKEITTTPSSNERKEVSSTEAEKTTVSSISWMDSLFSTEKATTYAADAFLADKFDLTNYESTDDEAPTNFNFDGSFEGSQEFW